MRLLLRYSNYFRFRFLVFAPEHTPKRARAYLVTDDDVARIAAYYGLRQPHP
jgi:hypothetical protein